MIRPMATFFDKQRDAAEIEASKAVLVWFENSGCLGSRLKQVRAKLPEIDRTPEYYAALIEIGRGEVALDDGLDDLAESCLSKAIVHFYHGEKRVARRLMSARAQILNRTGAQVSGETQRSTKARRDARIRARCEVLLAKGFLACEIAGRLAMEYKLTAGTIRRILK